MASSVPGYTNNFETDLFDSYMGPKQVLPVRFRVDLGVMARKGALHTSQISRTEPSDALSVILRTPTFWWSVTVLQEIPSAYFKPF